MKTTCKLCGADSNKMFEKKILGKYQIAYFQCVNCDFIQTEEPYWLAEAYKDPINTSDTGLIARNIYLSKISSLLIFFHFDKNSFFLDFAGGYGIFTRLMRDIGYNFLWHDPFTTNLFSKGFEWNKQKNPKVEIVTTFESFEHFTKPLEELEKMLSVSDNILFSTELTPKKDIANWWYLAPHHGQHISFYSKKSLEILASKYNLHLYSNDANVHLFSKNKARINLKLLQFLLKIKLDDVVRKLVSSKTNSDKITTEHFDQIL